MLPSFRNVFGSSFEAAVKEEPSFGIVEYCYPGAIRNGWVKGIGLEIFPIGGEPWFATFADGKLSPNGATGVIDLPDHKRILVVSKGTAYLVDAINPNQWDQLEISPVMGFEPVVELGLVLLWDFTRFVALGDHGILWKTPSVSWDGISAVKVQNGQAQAVVWNAATQLNETVVVDLKTGKINGGASPDLIDLRDGSQ